jgi:hypothetical protein
LCAGTGKLIDTKQPEISLEAEMEEMMTKTTAELLATSTPLGHKTSASLLTSRRRPHADLAKVLGEGYEPVAGAPFHEEQAHTHGEFVEGAEHAHKNFTGRLRAR